MPRRPPPADPPTLVPRLRVLHRGAIAIGPGKLELLESIAAGGSLAQAARALDMSYMRAWQLLQTMNAAFRAPLVELRRGGPAGGGARLTALGERVVELYREMERASRRASAPAWRRLERLLR
jgi:molybdate transport system regulatory protein